MDLILRSVRLQPNEEEEQAAGPAKPGLFSRAKAMTDTAVSRGKKLIAGDPVAGLAKALVPVRALLRRWDEIKAKHDARCNDSAYTSHLEKVQAKFSASGSPEDHERVFLAQAVLKERQAVTDTARRDAYSGSLEQEWIQFPDARNKIKTAVAAKIEATKVELERVRSKEQSHLGPKYDASDSPLVKSQANKVELWEQQLAQLDTRMVVYDAVMEAQRFFAAARLLVESDEGFTGKFIHKVDGDIYELERVDSPDSNPELAEFQHTHHLRSAVGGKYWEGAKADFEKCFKKS